MQARFLVLALAAASTVRAQFVDLATTTDGSVLYFASSLRQKGTTQPLHGKIFRYDAKGLSLYTARQSIAVSTELNRTLTNYFDLSMPQVSGDGSRVLYTGRAYCSGRGCAPALYFQTEPFQLEGQVRLSRNGRYAICSVQGLDCRLSDLETGESSRVPPPGNELGRIRAVADDGTFPFITNTFLYVRRKGVDTQLTSLAVEEPVQPIIDPAATKIVFTARWQVPNDTFSRIREANLATGGLRTLAEGYGNLTLPSLSDDGQRLLYLFDGSGVPQPYILDIDRADPRLLPGISEGVTTAILSGNGKVVYAVTPLGRLLKIDADSGAVSELIPRTLGLPEGISCVPGSLCILGGIGFLSGTKINVGGIEAPIFRVSANAIQFQMPWELGPSDLVLETPPSDASPFETRAVTKVSTGDFSPYVFPSPVPEKDALSYYSYFAFTISQNFDALITPLNPARPGDIVNVYMTGLGPVAVPQKTGVPASAEPLPHALTPVACKDAGILYSGLAPGLIGIYQLSLRLSPSIKVHSQIAGFYVDCQRFTLFVPGLN